MWTDVDYRFRFIDIWRTPEYEQALLHYRDPVFALMSPVNPDVLYFFLDQYGHNYIFGVDGRAVKMMGERESHELGDNATTASVRAWVMPPKEIGTIITFAFRFS